MLLTLVLHTNVVCSFSVIKLYIQILHARKTNLVALWLSAPGCSTQRVVLLRV